MIPARDRSRWIDLVQAKAGSRQGTVLCTDMYKYTTFLSKRLHVGTCFIVMMMIKCCDEVFCKVSKYFMPILRYIR